MAIGSPLPEISVSPAPFEQPFVEPFSPFDGSFAILKEDPDAYRPVHLTPPLSSASFPKQLSPLRPKETANEGSGIQRERFEALLKASRERQTAVAAKKDTSLLKEISLKTHKNKQIERRALFLSKVQAPPSPTATGLPKTPPESPAIFHYSLPSPGLASPLSLFETLDTSSTEANSSWVEQVDFKLPSKLVERRVYTKPVAPVIQAAKPSRPLPSLAQISAHIYNRTSSSEQKPSRLPAFLNAPRRLPSPPADRPRLATGVGRLNMPIRAPQPEKPAELLLPPLTPTSPLTPKLQVTTMLVPRTAAQSPTELTEINLQNFNAREQRAKNMLSAIRKRQPTPSECGFAGQDQGESGKRVMKRKSAPADLSVARADIWGLKPDIPGGF